MGRKPKQQKDKLHMVGITVTLEVKRELSKLAKTEANGKISQLGRVLIDEALESRKKAAA